MRSSIIFVFTLLFFTCSSQEILEHPTHPKGVNSNDQYEAIPFYNEAVELYHHGEIELAKKSLHEAINTSFALVEAQLFLGQIYYEKGDLDSAMIYLNSGIDFEINQPAHYYFMLFEAGMKHELYDVVIHNLKHFKKYYKNVDHGKYSSAYAFTVDDYEFYLNSVNLATNHNYWKSTGNELVRIPFPEQFQLYFNDGYISLQGENTRQQIKKKLLVEKKKVKIKEHKLTDDQWFSNGYSFKTETKGDSSLSYFKKEESNSWKLMPEIVNNGSWNGQFYFSGDHDLLYFSSNRNGNLDLFVVKLNTDSESISDLNALDRVNTDRDEQFPILKNDTFYFSSDGHIGFGGFDLFYTPDYSITNGVLYPTKAYNMGKPYNSGKDEIQIFVDSYYRYVNQTSWNNENALIIYTPKAAEEEFDYEIKMSKIPEDQ